MQTVDQEQEQVVEMVMVNQQVQVIILQQLHLKEIQVEQMYHLHRARLTELLAAVVEQGLQELRVLLQVVDQVLVQVEMAQHQKLQVLLLQEQEAVVEELVVREVQVVVLMVVLLDVMQQLTLAAVVEEVVDHLQEVLVVLVDLV